MKYLHHALTGLAFLAVLVMGALYVTTGSEKERLAAKLDQARAQREAVQGELAASTARAASLERRLAGRETDLAEARTQVARADDHALTLSRDLAHARTQLAAMEAADATRNEEMADLKRDLIHHRTLLASSASPEEVEGYRSAIAALEAQVAQLEETSAAPSASSASGRGLAALLPGHEARVVTVGPEDAFVILALGSKDGATLRQQWLVHRGDQPLATIEISDVRENLSIAHVRPDSLLGSPRQGDAATLLN